MSLADRCYLNSHDPHDFLLFVPSSAEVSHIKEGFHPCREGKGEKEQEWKGQKMNDEFNHVQHTHLQSGTCSSLRLMLSDGRLRCIYNHTTIKALPLWNMNTFNGDTSTLLFKGKSSSYCTKSPSFKLTYMVIVTRLRTTHNHNLI